MLTSMLQQLGLKEEQRKDLDDSLKKLEDMRNTHATSHQTAEMPAELDNKFLALFLEMEEKQFSTMQGLLRRQIILAGTRDYVAELRWQVFFDLIAKEPALRAEFQTMNAFLNALQQEYKEWQVGRIPERHLNTKWYEAVQRLGLQPHEWARLKALNADSVSHFHNKFTLQELETETFPPDLEDCRSTLLKAALKLQELQQQAATRTQPSDPSGLPESF